MAAAPQNAGELEPWRQSLDDAVATGELYSQAVPITPIERCNDIGQVYGGPVVAVVDANTYSAGDLFAAGFVDNELGPLVTVGEATGAGGANVWMPDDVQRRAARHARSSRRRCRRASATRISVRRATRAVATDGMAIEDVGVRGHRSYAMTRRDLVDGNKRPAEPSAGGCWPPSRRPALHLADADGGRVEVTTAGLDRLDVFVDDRPFTSRPVTDGMTTVDVPAGWSTVEAAAYRSDSSANAAASIADPPTRMWGDWGRYDDHIHPHSMGSAELVGDGLVGRRQLRARRDR